jgi:Zn-dependent protease
MNWSFQVDNTAGIPIRVHITFFVILLLGGYQLGSLTSTINGEVFGVALMILLFVCITLHELGHSLVARAFGVPVRDITLLPLGCNNVLATLASAPEDIFVTEIMQCEFLKVDGNKSLSEVPR